MRNRRLFQILWSVLWVSQVGSAAQQLSNTPRQDFWVTDGTVNAIAVTNDRVFIGGSFRYVGPYTGGGVPVNVNTMQPVAKYPKVNGSVHAVEPDGNGGWFIGGEFTVVGGRSRTNLAHITAAGEVNTNWVAHATGGDDRGLVEKLLLDGTTLYAAGSFTNLGGEPRKYVGAVDTVTAAVKPWAPQLDSNVLAMAVSPTAIYLGGKFFALNGNERRYVGAVDKVGGGTTTWNPWDLNINPIMFSGFTSNTHPYALAVVNGRVIVPGQFMTGFGWVRLAAFSETNSRWAWGMGMSGYVFDMKVNAGKLYVAGGFSSIGGSDGTDGGVPRKNLASIDLSVGVTSWNPIAAQIGEVRSLAFYGDSVFAVGSFIGANPGRNYGIRTNADHVVQLDLVSGAAVGLARPFNNGPIWAAASQGEHVFLGGEFDSMAGVQHEYLAELNGQDGSLRPWNPQPNEVVTALTIANGRLLVGGGFQSLGGMPRERLAAYDLATLHLSAWNPQIQRDTSIATGPAINELLPRDGAVFVAGNFQAVGGQPRTNLAKVDLSTGLPLTFRADANDNVKTLAIAGSYLYVGGEFSRLGGVDRSYLARVDVDSGVVDSWAPEPDSWVTSISANSTAIYVSGGFANIAGSYRSGGTAFSPLTGNLLPWTLDTYVLQPYRYVPFLLATDDLVYAVGGFITGADQRGLLAVDPTTTALDPWDTRPYFFWTSKRLLLEGGRLFVVGGDNVRSGLVVYELEGFSRFTRLDRGPSGVELGLSAGQGWQVTVERTADFNSWMGVSTNIAWEGLLEITDSMPPASDPVFYRAKTTN